MTELASLPPTEVAHRLQNSGLLMRIGPFTFQLQSDMPIIWETVNKLYRDFPISENLSFLDFHFSLRRATGIRRWIMPRIIVAAEGMGLFEDGPIGSTVAYWEWGINRCVFTQAHQYLMLHSSVLEKNGHALLIVGGSGSGKSTLSAALAFHGWRLLSDEMALLDPKTGLVYPMVKAITLKNEAIEVIQKHVAEAEFGPPSENTVKGLVRHLKPPQESVFRNDEPAKPRWFVFVDFQRDAPLQLDPLPRGSAMLRIAENSFNYGTWGEEGFHFLGSLVQQGECYTLRYGHLAEAIARFNRAEFQGR